MLRWLSENIAETGFKDYDEALREWYLCKEANSKVVKENAAFYGFLKSVLKIHGPEIYAEVVQEVQISKLGINSK